MPLYRKGHQTYPFGFDLCLDQRHFGVYHPHSVAIGTDMKEFECCQCFFIPFILLRARSVLVS